MAWLRRIHFATTASDEKPEVIARIYSWSILTIELDNATEHNLSQSGLKAAG